MLTCDVQLDIVFVLCDNIMLTGLVNGKNARLIEPWGYSEKRSVLSCLSCSG